MVSDFRRLIVAQKTDRGLRREINEDSCDFRIPESGTPEAAFGALFLVADGIGGIGGGEEASRAAVETMMATYYDPDLEDDNPRERLIAAIQDANEAVRARARVLNLQALGTTLAGVIILASEQAYLFNVGDSRIYLLRGETIEQVTADHSSIDTADSQNSYARAKLTAFIGQFQPILPYIAVRELEKDDSLLICSDGLWGLVDAHEIAAVVQQNAPQKAVDRLIGMVYERGARDNVTITLIRNSKRETAFNTTYALLALALLVIALIMGFFAFVQPMMRSGRATDTPTPQIAPATARFRIHAPDSLTPSPASQIVGTIENQGQIVIRTPTPATKIKTGG